MYKFIILLYTNISISKNDLVWFNIWYKYSFIKAVECGKVVFFFGDALDGNNSFYIIFFCKKMQLCSLCIINFSLCIESYKSAEILTF